MKKNELPQDKSALENFTREVCYVKNDDGKYEADLSIGWETKKIALDQAWEEIERRKKEALDKVKDGKVSPIVYFMELKLMDFNILAAYSGFRKWQIKRHLKPNVFQKLKESKLQKYCQAFDITLEELKNCTTH